MSGTVIILQARTGSSRFPGKVLYEVQGICLLSHCIRRLFRVRNDIPVVVATSTRPEDDAVVRVAEAEGAAVFRGSECDVLDRFYGAVFSERAAEYIVRATADNPLVDPCEAGKVVSKIETGRWDYVCGFEPVNGICLPKGVGVEAFTAEMLKTAWLKGDKPEHREHINEYFFEHSDLYKIAYVECEPENSCVGLNLSVDYPSDLERLCHIGSSLNKPLLDLQTAEIVALRRQEGRS